MKSSPGPPAQPSCRVPEDAAASGAGADARTCRTATHRPGSGPESEHAAEYPGGSAPAVLPLLHDFPDPGRFHRFPGSSPPSDTVIPYISLFPGMPGRHPCVGLPGFGPGPRCAEHGGVFHFGEVDGDAGGSARPSLRERRGRRGDRRRHRALPGFGPGAWARRAGGCLVCR
jgi:hypothetical protein